MCHSIVAPWCCETDWEDIPKHIEKGKVPAHEYVPVIREEGLAWHEMQATEASFAVFQVGMLSLGPKRTRAGLSLPPIPIRVPRVVARVGLSATFSTKACCTASVKPP